MACLCPVLTAASVSTLVGHTWPQFSYGWSGASCGMLGSSGRFSRASRRASQTALVPGPGPVAPHSWPPLLPCCSSCSAPHPLCLSSCLPWLWTGLGSGTSDTPRATVAAACPCPARASRAELDRQGRWGPRACGNRGGWWGPSKAASHPPPWILEGRVGTKARGGPVRRGTGGLGLPSSSQAPPPPCRANPGSASCWKPQWRAWRCPPSPSWE